jgi:hypothetical protein
MTKEEANQLLDNLKDGKPYPQILINRALAVSGDIGTPYLDGETASGEGICLAQGEAVGC